MKPLTAEEIKELSKRFIEAGLKLYPPMYIPRSAMVIAYCPIEKKGWKGAKYKSIMFRGERK